MEANIRLVECASSMDETIWYTTCNYNGLFQMNTKTGETEFLGVIPWEKKLGKRLFYNIHYYNNLLILTPYKAQYIAVYNLVTKDFYRCETPIAFSATYLHDGIVYCLPAASGVGKCIYAYNIEENSIESVLSLEHISSNYNSSQILSYSNGKLWFCLIGSKELVSFDLVNHKSSIVQMPKNGDSYYSVIVDNDIAIATSIKKPYVVSFDLNGKIIAEYKPTSIYANKEILYWMLVKLRDKIYVKEIAHSSIYEIDVNFEGKKEVSPIEKIVSNGMMLGMSDELVVLPTIEQCDWRFLNGYSIPYKPIVPHEIQRTLLKEYDGHESYEVGIEDFCRIIVEEE